MASRAIGRCTTAVKGALASQVGLAHARDYTVSHTRVPSLSKVFLESGMFGYCGGGGMWYLG